MKLHLHRYTFNPYLGLPCCCRRLPCLLGFAECPSEFPADPDAPLIPGRKKTIEILFMLVFHTERYVILLS